MIIITHEIVERVFDIPAETEEEMREIFENTAVSDLNEIEYEVISRRIIKIDDEEVK